MDLPAILISVVGLGVIIFVHEFGHFLLAKLNGVKVEVFSLGYGPKLVGFEHGGTTYQIGVFPFGGYCKMAGEELKDGTQGASYEYFSKSPPARISIALAGPAFNYLFGVLLFSLLLLVPRTYEAPEPIIDVLPTVEVREPVPPDPAQPFWRRLRPRFETQRVAAPALEAGLRSGDRILAVDGKPVRSWNDLSPAINRGFTTPKTLTVLRGSETFTVTVRPVMDRATGFTAIGVIPWAEPVVDEVVADSAADLAGLRKGDRLLMVGNRPVRTVGEVLQALESSGPRVFLIVRRDGVDLKRQATLPTKDGRPALGVLFATPVRSWTNRALPPHRALLQGVLQANGTIAQNIQGFRQLFSGRLSWRTSVSGPVRIFDLSARIARQGGLQAFLGFMALLSCLLAFINLLPIPPIDGSFILVFLAEWVSRRPLNRRFLEAVQAVGFVLLVLITGTILLNDILSLVSPVP